MGLAPVVLAGAADDEAAVLKAAEDAGQRARVEAQDAGQLAGGRSRVVAENPHHQPLGARDAEAGLHPLGCGLRSMAHPPDDAHEPEDAVRRQRRVALASSPSRPEVRLSPHTPPLLERGVPPGRPARDLAVITNRPRRFCTESNKSGRQRLALHVAIVAWAFGGRARKSVAHNGLRSY